MSHEITEIDAVYSTTSREWHGLAQHVQTINAQELETLQFPIVKGDLLASIDGESVALEDYQPIIADARQLPQVGKIVPLSIMGAKYSPIENSAMFEAVMAGLDASGIDYSINTAGTLSGLKKVFLSIMIGKKTLNAEENQLLNFVSSHDGTCALEGFLSFTRICCANTFAWARQGADEKLKIRHTANASAQIDNFPRYIDAMLNGSLEYELAIETLGNQPASETKARNVLAGFYADKLNLKASAPLSTRTLNQIDDVVNLSKHGAGNRGETMLDLHNGFTDSYSNGVGVGGVTRKAGKAAYRSNFGSSKDVKSEFMQAILSADTVGEFSRRGQHTLALSV